MDTEGFDRRYNEAALLLLAAGLVEKAERLRHQPLQLVFLIGREIAEGRVAPSLGVQLFEGLGTFQYDGWVLGPEGPTREAIEAAPSWEVRGERIVRRYWLALDGSHLRIKKENLPARPEVDICFHCGADNGDNGSSRQGHDCFMCGSN